MVRTPFCDQNGLKKGTWTPEEDRKLIAYVTRYGCWNWRQLPKFAGLSRCGKSCRLRWLNYLRPNIKRGNYTKEEEETIIRLHESLGNRWSAIAAKLPGRTDNEIKNHWHTNLKKRVKHNSATNEPKPKPKAHSKREKSHHHQKNKSPINSTFPRILESTTMPWEEQPRQETRQVVEQHITEQYANGLIVSPMPSPQPSSSDLSSITTSSDDLIPDNGFVSLESYEAPGGNFWSEPFLAEDYYNMPGDFLSPLEEVVLHSTFVEGELPFCAYSLY